MTLLSQCIKRQRSNLRIDREWRDLAHRPRAGFHASCDPAHCLAKVTCSFCTSALSLVVLVGGTSIAARQLARPMSRNDAAMPMVCAFGLSGMEFLRALTGATVTSSRAARARAQVG